MKKQPLLANLILLGVLLSACGGDKRSSRSSAPSSERSQTSSCSSSTPTVIDDNSIRLLSPAEGESVQVSDQSLLDYCSASSESAEIAALLSAERVSSPSLPVTLSWENDGSAYYDVHYGLSPDLSDASTERVSGILNRLSLANLIPQKTYYWQVEGTEDEDASAVRSFQTTGSSVRFITASGGDNIRDLGGYSASGGAVSYGKLFRGAQLNGFNGGPKLDEEGIRTLFGELGVKTEIDLRNPGRDNGGLSANYGDPKGGFLSAPMGQYDRVYDPEIFARGQGYDSYAALSSADYPTAWGDHGISVPSLRAIFSTLADEDSYPVYFHCNTGSDRTGTLAFLLEGLLGVSYEDIVKDYELSSYSLAGARYRSDLNAEKTAFTDAGAMAVSGNYIAFGRLYRDMMDAYAGEGGSLKEAVSSYLVDYVGVAPSEIASFRRIMLGEQENSALVSGDRQDLLLTEAAGSIDLRGSLDEVSSLTLGSVSLGKDPSHIELSALSSLPGEREIVAVGQKGGARKTVYVPVRVVSAKIKTADDFKALAYAGAKNVYGCYLLDADLGSESSPVDLSNGYVGAVGNDYFSQNGGVGFRGTLDGQGHTIHTKSSYGGLFGVIGGGARFLNLNLIDYGYQGGDYNLLSRAISGASFENCSFSLGKGSSGSSALASSVGWLATCLSVSNRFSSCIFASALAPIPSLLGGTNWAGSYDNRFSSCTLTSAYLGALYTQDGLAPILPETVEGLTGSRLDTSPSVQDIHLKKTRATLDFGSAYQGMNVTSLSEGETVLGPDSFTVKGHQISFEAALFYADEDAGSHTLTLTMDNGKGFAVTLSLPVNVISSVDKVYLTETQEFLLNDDAAKALNLGDYSSYEIDSIKVGSLSLGNDPSHLDLSALKEDKSLHGEQEAVVLCHQGDVKAELHVSLLLITEEITSLDQIKTDVLAKCFADANPSYGYYRLAQDIGGETQEFRSYNGSLSNAPGWENAQVSGGSALFFRGTFDGNGHSISGISSTWGLFGACGRGCVIKNLTVNDYNYSGGGDECLLATALSGTRVVDCTFNLLGGNGVSAYAMRNGWISSICVYETSFENCAFHAAGYSLNSLFGTQEGAPANWAGVSFANCTLSAKSIITLSCNGQTSGMQYDEASGLTITLG